MCTKISQIRVNYVTVLIPIVSGVKERALPYFSLIFKEMVFQKKYSIYVLFICI